MSALPHEHDEAVADMVEYVVLGRDDRIVRVGPGLYERFGPFVGQVLWERIPGAEPLYRPHFDEARRTGTTVEFTVFYVAELKRLRATPIGEELTVHIRRLRNLDVRTLETLAESLRTIESELAAPASAPRGRPTLVSPPALP